MAQPSIAPADAPRQQFPKKDYGNSQSEEREGTEGEFGCRQSEGGEVWERTHGDGELRCEGTVSLQGCRVAGLEPQEEIPEG